MVPFGNRGLEQIWQSRAAVLPAPREQLHHHSGALEVVLIDVQTGIGAQFLACSDEILVGSSAVQNLELQDPDTAT